jgi:sigma-E factor negative regulatory protein RseC
METIKEGLVIAEEGNCARIKVFVHSECNGCGTCTGTDVVMLALNPLHAKVNEKIRISLPEQKTIGVAFILFLGPILSLFFGAFLGNVIASRVHVNRIAFTIAGGLLFLAVFLLLIFRYERKSRSQSEHMPRIIEIVS